MLQRAKGTIIEEIDGAWYALAIRKRELDNIPELPGGQCEGENPKDAFIRKFPLETRVSAFQYHEAYKDEGAHTTFFLGINPEKVMTLDSIVWLSGRYPSQLIRPKMIEVREFYALILSEHKKAFAHIMLKKAQIDARFSRVLMQIAERNKDFPIEYSELLDKLTTNK